MDDDPWKRIVPLDGYWAAGMRPNGQITLTVHGRAADGTEEVVSIELTREKAGNLVLLLQLMMKPPRPPGLETRYLSLDPVAPSMSGVNGNAT